MPDFVILFAVLHIPALLICGIFYIAGRHATRPKVGKWLRISALGWLAILWIIFTLIGIAMETCTGNMLYGYQHCTALPTQIANLSLPAFVFGVGAAVIYGAVMAVTATILELRHRRRDATAKNRAGF